MTSVRAAESSLVALANAPQCFAIRQRSPPPASQRVLNRNGKRPKQLSAVTKHGPTSRGHRHRPAHLGRLDVGTDDWPGPPINSRQLEHRSREDQQDQHGEPDQTGFEVAEPSEATGELGI